MVMRIVTGINLVKIIRLKDMDDNGRNTGPIFGGRVTVMNKDDKKMAKNEVKFYHQKRFPY